MANVVKYNDEKVLIAYKLLKQKGIMDDNKAGQDLYILDLILSGVQTCVDKYSLDERLRTEYKTIEEMEKIQDKFCYNDGRQTMGVTPENIIMSNLKSDRAGIIADVLIKHRVIKDVEELYEKNNYSV
ncbi:MAG: hypothetical protein ACLR6A_03830 [Candidatus Gastranaerophilaceae bacterium]